MGMVHKQPKTVSQIMKGFKKLLDELSVSEAQYEEKQRKADEKLRAIEAEKKDIDCELQANRTMANKLKEFVGE